MIATITDHGKMNKEEKMLLTSRRMMEKLTKRSASSEQGFLLCSFKDTIIPSSKYVIGTYSEIEQSEMFSLGCPRNGKIIGYFHTHTNATAIPTRTDVLICGQRGLKYICVGSYNYQEIRCYIIPDNILYLAIKAQEEGDKLSMLFKKLSKQGYSIKDIENNSEYKNKLDAWWNNEIDKDKTLRDFAISVEYDITKPICIWKI